MNPQPVTAPPRSSSCLLLLVFPLSLILAAIFRMLAGGAESIDRKVSCYTEDMAAMAYVARANDLRARMPGRSLESILESLRPCLPPGFTVRILDENELSHWGKHNAFLVERESSTKKASLIISSDGLTGTYKPVMKKKASATAWPPQPDTTPAVR